MSGTDPVMYRDTKSTTVLPPTAKFCGECGREFAQAQLRASTSQGDRCMACAPAFFHVNDDGASIGLREVWPNGAVVRRIQHATVTVQP